MGNYIIYSINSENIDSYIKCISSLLKNNNSTFTLYNEAEKIIKSNHFDAAIVLGGDGTILRASHELSYLSVPIMGINLGSVGYLASYERDDIDSAIDSLIKKDYCVESRTVIECTLKNLIKETTTVSYAVNDFTVHRSSFNGTIPYRVFINDTYIDTFRADGFIICTATGSTAYNFSAGGPILNPLSEDFIFTPICAHSMFSHSIVLRKNDILKIDFDFSEKKYSSLFPLFSSDGIENITLDGAFSLECKTSDKILKLIRPINSNFYEILRKKIH